AGGSPTPKITTSSVPMILNECPAPEVSSTTTTLPIGKRRTMPLLVVTSYSPRIVTKIMRRGAACGVSSFQVLGAPIQKLPSVARNGAEKLEVAIPGGEKPGCNSIARSSKRDPPCSSTKSRVYLACIGMPYRQKHPHL